MNTHLIHALIDVELIERTPGRRACNWLPHSKDYHVLAISVLVVSDVGDAVQRMAAKHTLLLLISDFDPVFGERDDLNILCTCHPRNSPLPLKKKGQKISIAVEGHSQNT